MQEVIIVCMLAPLAKVWWLQTVMHDSGNLWFQFQFRFQAASKSLILIPIPIPTKFQQKSPDSTPIPLWFHSDSNSSLKSLIPIPIPGSKSLIPILIPIPGVFLRPSMTWPSWSFRNRLWFRFRNCASLVANWMKKVRRDWLACPSTLADSAGGTLYFGKFKFSIKSCQNLKMFGTQHIWIVSQVTFWRIRRI